MVQCAFEKFHGENMFVATILLKFSLQLLVKESSQDVNEGMLCSPTIKVAS